MPATGAAPGGATSSKRPRLNSTRAAGSPETAGRERRAYAARASPHRDGVPRGLGAERPRERGLVERRCAVEPRVARRGATSVSRAYASAASSHAASPPRARASPASVPPSASHAAGSRGRARRDAPEGVGRAREPRLVARALERADRAPRRGRVGVRRDEPREALDRRRARRRVAPRAQRRRPAAAVASSGSRGQPRVVDRAGEVPEREPLLRARAQRRSAGDGGAAAAAASRSRIASAGEPSSSSAAPTTVRASRAVAGSFDAASAWRCAARRSRRPSAATARSAETPAPAGAPASAASATSGAPAASAAIPAATAPAGRAAPRGRRRRSKAPPRACRAPPPRRRRPRRRGRGRPRPRPPDRRSRNVGTARRGAPPAGTETNRTVAAGDGRRQPRLRVRRDDRGAAPLDRDAQRGRGLGRLPRGPGGRRRSGGRPPRRTRGAPGFRPREGPRRDPLAGPPQPDLLHDRRAQHQEDRERRQPEHDGERAPRAPRGRRRGPLRRRNLRPRRDVGRRGGVRAAVAGVVGAGQRARPGLHGVRSGVPLHRGGVYAVRPGAPVGRTPRSVTPVDAPETPPPPPPTPGSGTSGGSDTPPRGAARFLGPMARRGDGVRCLRRAVFPSRIVGGC